MPTSSLDQEPSWGHGQAALRDALARNPSLCSNLGSNNKNNNNNQGEENRQALGGNCSHPASSLRFLTAWEETRCEEQKLLQNPHFTQLRAEVASLTECVGHLVRLLDSFHRESPMHILEHVRERACNDKLVQTEGAEQNPIETCSLATCKPKEEHNRVDVSKHKQQQLEQPQKQEQEEEQEEEEKEKKRNFRRRSFRTRRCNHNTATTA